MSVNTAAEQKEKNAFKAVGKLLGKADVFASPAGSAAGFPDFGYSVKMGKRRIDLFFEYKADHTAQMGSMRNWIFTNSKFTVPSADLKDENKQLLLEIMNKEPSAKKEANVLLAGFRKYFGTKMKKISSGVLSEVEPNKKMRQVKLKKFYEKAARFQIANIENPLLGQKIMDHYYKKFKVYQQPGAGGSMLLMMIDHEIWWMKSDKLSKAEEELIFKMLGTKTLPKLPPLTAKLECRISPRGYSKQGDNARIDVLAVFRLSKRPAAGYKVKF